MRRAGPPAQRANLAAAAFDLLRQKADLPQIGGPARGQECGLLLKQHLNLRVIFLVAQRLRKCQLGRIGALGLKARGPQQGCGATAAQDGRLSLRVGEFELQELLPLLDQLSLAHEDDADLATRGVLDRLAVPFDRHFSRGDGCAGHRHG